MATGQYDDAWETTGWTSQNMAYPPTSNDPAYTPIGLPKIRVFGEFRSEEGRPLNGIVRATPSKRITAFEGKEVAIQEVVQEVRNGLADFEIATGDWTWTISQRIGPTTRKTEGLQPTADLDLSTLL